MRHDYSFTPLSEADLSNPSRVLVLDVETTGLNPDIADVLQCAVVDGDGNLVHNRFYGSVYRSWPEAYVVNRISPEMVEGLPLLRDCAAEVSEAIAGARTIMGYNLAFDLSMLEAAGVAVPRCCLVDVMADWARMRQQYVLRRWSLTSAASHIGLYTVNEHDALDDSLRTLDVARYLLRERA